MVILAAILSTYAMRIVALAVWDAPIANSEETTDFKLELFGEPGGVDYIGDQSPSLPLFQPDTGFWSLDGNQVDDFGPLVQGFEIDAHGSFPFVVVELSKNATVGEYRKALASLAAHGMCRIGVYAPEATREYRPPNAMKTGTSNETFVPVYRVLNVRREAGTRQACIDRFPAWTAPNAPAF